MRVEINSRKAPSGRSRYFNYFVRYFQYSATSASLIGPICFPVQDPITAGPWFSDISRGCRFSPCVIIPCNFHCPATGFARPRYTNRFQKPTSSRGNQRVARAIVRCVGNSWSYSLTECIATYQQTFLIAKCRFFVASHSDDNSKVTE